MTAWPISSNMTESVGPGPDPKSRPWLLEARRSCKGAKQPAKESTIVGVRGRVLMMIIGRFSSASDKYCVDGTRLSEQYSTRQKVSALVLIKFVMTFPGTEDSK